MEAFRRFTTTKGTSVPFGNPDPEMPLSGTIGKRCARLSSGQGDILSPQHPIGHAMEANLSQVGCAPDVSPLDQTKRD